MVRNPNYKGEWKPKTIPNPEYKGPWQHPKINNPDYKPDSNLYLMEDIGGIGIEIWQVTSGTIFDNIFVGDDPDEAKKFADRTFQYRKDGEKGAKEAFDAEQTRLREEALENIGDYSEDDYEPTVEELREEL